MAICYIVGGGEPYGRFTPLSHDFVIAADAGYDYLLKMGVRCDLLVGDLDSIRSIPTDIETVRVPVRKDETDMYLAFLEGRRRGYTSFIIYGGTGGSPDHTFANYCLLAKIAKEGCNAILKGDTGDTYAVHNRGVTLISRAGKRLSVFAFGEVAEGVTIEGAEYEAAGLTLYPDTPVGVSNSFITDMATVAVARGTLLVMVEK